MIGEVNVGGVFLSSVLVTALVALCLNFLLRRLLAWAGVYRLVWHPALFDTALFFVLWGAVSRLPFPF